MNIGRATPQFEHPCHRQYSLCNLIIYVTNLGHWKALHSLAPVQLESDATKVLLCSIWDFAMTNILQKPQWYSDRTINFNIDWGQNNHKLILSKQLYSEKNMEADLFDCPPCIRDPKFKCAHFPIKSKSLTNYLVLCC